MTKAVTKAQWLSRIADLSAKIGKFEREHKALHPGMKPAHLAAIEALKQQLQECSRKITQMSWTL